MSPPLPPWQRRAVPSGGCCTSVSYTHLLEKKKNIRLLELPGLYKANSDMLDMKKVAGGLLVQELDTQLFDADNLKVVTKRAPTEEELRQLKFAIDVYKRQALSCSMRPIPLRRC